MAKKQKKSKIRFLNKKGEEGGTSESYLFAAGLIFGVFFLLFVIDLTGGLIASFMGIVEFNQMTLGSYNRMVSNFEISIDHDISISDYYYDLYDNPIVIVGDGADYNVAGKKYNNAILFLNHENPLKKAPIEVKQFDKKLFVDGDDGANFKSLINPPNKIGTDFIFNVQSINSNGDLLVLFDDKKVACNKPYYCVESDKCTQNSVQAGITKNRFCGGDRVCCVNN